MTEEEMFMANDCARYAQSYLRKMRQWMDGKIDLTVEGCDPPYMMSEDEWADESKNVAKFIDKMDEYIATFRDC